MKPHHLLLAALFFLLLAIFARPIGLLVDFLIRP